MVGVVVVVLYSDLVLECVEVVFEVCFVGWLYSVEDVLFVGGCWCNYVLI